MSKLRGTPEGLLVIWGMGLNGVWEFLHSPLYADHTRGLAYILWTRLHCTVGDLLILLFAFWTTSLLFRTRYWISKGSGLAVVVFVSLGLAYTAWSEWFNTSIRLTWSYSPTMPTVFGIGLSPLLQWVIIPLILLLLMKKTATPTPATPRPSPSQIME